MILLLQVKGFCFLSSKSTKWVLKSVFFMKPNLNNINIKLKPATEAQLTYFNTFRPSLLWLYP